MPTGKAGSEESNPVREQDDAKQLSFSLFFIRPYYPCAGISRSLCTAPRWKTQPRLLPWVWQARPERHVGKWEPGVEKNLPGTGLIHIISPFTGNLAEKAELSIRNVQPWAHHWGTGATAVLHQGPVGPPQTATIPLNKAQLELTCPFVMYLSPVPFLFRLLKLATAPFTTWRELLGSHLPRLTVGEWYFKGTDVKPLLFPQHSWRE